MHDQVLTPWLYRRWRFDFPAELYPAILERLRGTPARAEELTASIDSELLTRAPVDGWSIQRHIAHLTDLEALLHTRLDAYEAGEPLLPAADMSNVRTVAAAHEDRLIEEVLGELRNAREASMQRLESYPRDFFSRSAWHDRLDVQKRVVDTCTFFADHDDHHLALARGVGRALQL